jgi:hypothetical protein
MTYTKNKDTILSQEKIMKTQENNLTANKVEFN